MAIKFSYVEKFLIIVFALTVIASISQGSMLVGLLSGSFGILLSLIGTYESTSGGNDHTRLMTEALRPILRNGFSLLPVLIGMFALTAIFQEAEKGAKEGEHQKLDLAQGAKFKFSVFKGQVINIFRSGIIGTFVGLLPGVGEVRHLCCPTHRPKTSPKSPIKWVQEEPRD